MAFLLIGLLLWLRPLKLLPWTSHFKSRRMGLFVVAFSSLFPLGYTFATQPVLYDGLRHFLFVLPPLAILAGVGLARALEALSKRGLYVALVALALVFAAQIWQSARLYPYTYIWFNAWVGGLPGAYEHWETDYWGLSYREAVETLEAYVSQQYAGAAVPPLVIAVSPGSAPWHIEPFLPEGWEVAFRKDALQRAHFCLSYTRMQEHLLIQSQAPQAVLVGAVQREGVPLNIIWQLRPLPNPMSQAAEYVPTLPKTTKAP